MQQQLQYLKPQKHPEKCFTKYFIFSIFINNNFIIKFFFHAKPPLYYYINYIDKYRINQVKIMKKYSLRFSYYIKFLLIKTNYYYIMRQKERVDYD